MKISLNWLSDLIELDKNLDIDELAWKITEGSAEIEHIEKLGKDLENVVVGEVIESEKHPDADKLTVNKVDVGNGEILPIVCGAPNMRKGIKVALAKIGASVRWHGEGDPVVMEKAKIRGEVSEGMACAPEEIGLSGLFDIDGIIELETDAAPGTPIAKALGLEDTIFDIDNHAITHRSDLFSQRGFAREIAALGFGKLKQNKLQEKAGTNKIPFKINLEEKAVHSYAGVIIKNITDQTSPDWMQKRLLACGIRSLGLIVDVTNYVMLEMGMPLHAFDLDFLQNAKSLNFRLSKKGEKVTTLDGIERELSDNIIIADDGEKIIDLCGIMGGENSGIKDETKNIFLHSPVYDSVLIRRGMIALKHRTDAGTIYEKGVDPYLAKEGLLRAIELILEICPEAEVDSELFELEPKTEKPKEIEAKKEYIEKLLGAEVNSEDIKNIEPLGFEISETDSEIIITPPTWRKDVTIPADIAEEIARIKGYNQIPEELPRVQVKSHEKQIKRKVEKIIRRKLIGLGFHETINYSLLGKKILRLSDQQDLESSLIGIENAVSEDFEFFRPNLVPRLLETVQRNTYATAEEIKLFEIGKVAELEGDKFIERTDCGIVYSPENSKNIFYELKGFVENVLDELGIEANSSAFDDLQPFLHPARNAEFKVDDAVLGYIGEIHPNVIKNFDLKKPLAIAMFDVESLAEHMLDETVLIKSLPEYPSVERDIASFFPYKTEAGELLRKLITASELLENVEIFDVYTDEKLKSEDKKSIAFRLTYRSDEHTLKEAEIEKEQDKVIKLIKELGGEIRA